MPRDEVAQRRAQGWDAVSYGIGGSAGPAAVAALAAVASPLVAMLALCCAALLAGCWCWRFRPEARHECRPSGSCRCGARCG